MPHDIYIVNVKTPGKFKHTYISGNFFKYRDKYPGVYAIHGHKNSTVIKIIRKTLDLLLDDEIVPCLNKFSKPDIVFGDQTDPIRDLQCYAACLQMFLYIAFGIQRKNMDHDNMYWYSKASQWKITKFISDDYESDGLEQSEDCKFDSDEDVLELDSE